MEGCELDQSGSEQKQVAGSSEHGNEDSGSLKGGVFLLADCKLLKNYSAPLG
jgi:hypothetical protein